jgi:hypothetical protein
VPGRYVFDDPFFRRWVQLCGPDIGETTPPLLLPRESSSSRDRNAHQSVLAAVPRSWSARTAQ